MSPFDERGNEHSKLRQPKPGCLSLERDALPLVKNNDFQARRRIVPDLMNEPTDAAAQTQRFNALPADSRCC